MLDTFDLLTAPALIGSQGRLTDFARDHCGIDLDGPRWVEVVDTGGIGIVDRDDLGPHVEAQVDTALKGADLVLFLVDVRDGLTPPDKQVAALLRGADVPVQLVVNKAEGGGFEWEAESFHALGVGGEPMVISAQNGEGIGELRQCVADHLPGAPEERPEEL